ERASANGSRQSRTAKTEATEEQSGKSVDEIVAARNKKGKKKKAGKVILIILLVLVLIAGIGYAVLEFVIKPPDTDNKGVTDNTNTHHVDGRKDGVYTFLVAGTDQISNNTDTIMIGSFDTVNHKLNIVSIPRDTLINIQHEVKKANAAYHYAAYYKNVEGSSYYNCDPVESMRKELVKSMLGFDVDKYVLVNIDAAAEVVDAIGGVEFDLPVDMNYDSKRQDLHIHLNKGLQTLSGDDFVKVMRFRSSYAGGDLQRIEMQQKLLSALADQMLTLGNVPNLTKVAQIVADNMETDMSTENIIYFAKEFLKLSKDDVKFMTLPKLSTGSVFGFSYVFADIDAWLKMVNESLNPWTTEVTAQNVDIITYKDGNFYSTTGEVNNGIESFLSYNSSDPMASAQVIRYTGSGTSDTNTQDNTQDKDVDNQ
ncbi:MAG: LCP family protein, partial [Christensenellales bacterium]